jgi:pyocin large subunit-like protein
VRANGRKLLATLPPEGITDSELHKRPPAGLSRAGARAAREHLSEVGAITRTAEVRGRNRQLVDVYRRSEGKQP